MTEPRRVMFRLQKMDSPEYPQPGTRKARLVILTEDGVGAYDCIVTTFIACGDFNTTMGISCDQPQGHAGNHMGDPDEPDRDGWYLPVEWRRA